MEELIMHFSDLLNIKIESTFTVADMEEEIKAVKNLVAYRHYIRDNIDHFDLKYKTGIQKFIFLSQKYREQEEAATIAPRLPAAEKFCLELCEKVNAVANNVLDNGGLDYDHFKAPGGGAYFTDYEKKELSSIGLLQWVVRLQKSVSGVDALYHKLEKRAIAAIRQPQIAAKTQKGRNDASPPIKMAIKRF